ncbi:HNH endonuclease [Deinococcus malanensis]|uniref:HNH endonuclease n=1 Tax=Deinococcus malanensis TaxID=1706855 RepID=A0ABQ2EMA4_9DEIO|nr:HNH endonuclease [Deinococcus malanensis]GGK16995.1 HNH endonuclease [Deinococcus malanensis]
MARRQSNSTWPDPTPEAEPLACALCQRETPVLTQHHLMPVLAGRRKGMKVQDLPTVGLCSACHGYVHNTFSNADLAGPYSSLEALQEHEGVIKFVKWVQKQPVSRAVKVK